MQTNLPVWNYYPKDDGYFLDPLYVPYQKKNIKVNNNLGERVSCPIYPWALKDGFCEDMVNPSLIRKGWGQTFQLMFPEKDPCPLGFIKQPGGWCIRDQPEFGDHGLYSKDAFIPMYQYFDGYAAPSGTSKETTELDPTSINPFTGNFVVYNKPYPSKNTTKYLSLPSKSSLLA